MVATSIWSFLNPPEPAEKPQTCVFEHDSCKTFMASIAFLSARLFSVLAFFWLLDGSRADCRKILVGGTGAGEGGLPLYPRFKMQICV